MKNSETYRIEVTGETRLELREKIGISDRQYSSMLPDTYIEELRKGRTTNLNYWNQAVSEVQCLSRLVNSHNLS